jgi:sulfide:quinone oxidoreductase
MSPSTPHRVVIAGGGVAALEALVALHELAGDRVETTVLAPTAQFAVRADAVTAAFGRHAPTRHDIAMVAADNGAVYRRDALRLVRREIASVLTQRGEPLSYDSLLVAVGASPRPHPGLYDAICFRGDAGGHELDALLAEIGAGRVTSVVFVVPPGATWALPLYELALLTAEHADALGRDLSITVVTPEAHPVAAMGHEVGIAIAGALRERGIRLLPGVRVQRLRDDELLDSATRPVARADRVVALPVLAGPRLRGLPHDRDGFIPVDGFGAVRGVPGVYAAGDATTVPYKQGGLAAQQAEVAARRIAAAAGADVVAEPLRPTLRAHMATGPWLRGGVRDAGTRRSAVADRALWWPPTKVAMPYLGRYLGRADAPVG